MLVRHQRKNSSWKQKVVSLRTWRIAANYNDYHEKSLGYKIVPGLQGQVARIANYNLAAALFQEWLGQVVPGWIFWHMAKVLWS